MIQLHVGLQWLWCPAEHYFPRQVNIFYKNDKSTNNIIILV